MAPGTLLKCGATSGDDCRARTSYLSLMSRLTRIETPPLTEPTSDGFTGA
jgi:hypothetical protein